MNWPPVKAWTSKLSIEGQIHFVTINYGGKPLERWVILMSVIDSSLVVKVSWSQLVDPYNWECGWAEIYYSSFSKRVNNKYELITNNCAYPSLDSGLTLPIIKNNIRPWFDGV